ncbi:zinc ribbon domain-containing protein [Streptomyces sp. NPDC093982]|uniref:zinc ribbon domain-containing protein n=1 Tax=Streptomyces sp. NPDC093982 TaxID=3155077 RepID=UPI00341D28EB
MISSQHFSAINPRNTSRRCPECGHTAKENRPTQETFLCVSCGHHAHARWEASGPHWRRCARIGGCTQASRRLQTSRRHARTSVGAYERVL